MKKKKNNPVYEIEDEEFVIYQIDEELNNPGKKTFKPSQVCSPFFGSNVVNKKSYVDNAGSVNVDYGYDYVRKQEDKHLSKEQIIAEKGSEYYEFQIYDNESISKIAGGYKEKEEGIQTKLSNDDDSAINAFIEDATALKDEDELKINIPEDLETVVLDPLDENADFDIKIGIDTEEEYEYNTYSDAMPKPSQVNVPSFLADDNKQEEVKLSFDNFDTVEEDNTAFEEIIKEDTYSNPAVNRNISISEAIAASNNGKDIPTIVEEKKAYEAPRQEYVAPKPEPAPMPKPEPKRSYDTQVSFNKYDDYKIPYKDLFPMSAAALEDAPAWLEEKKQIINDTFKSFGIDGEVINYTKGPAFTLYEIMLAPGVNVKKVNQIYDNIQMNLQAKSIRLLSPIPGKNTIGIEAPNDVAEVVKFGDILNDEYVNSKKNLSVALGKNIDGSPVYQDITEMPHALIAGATQSGKSVSINTILVSLLIKNSPEDLKLILVDPKKVELSFYNDLPHLATPVIDDPVEATEALKWACEEMDRRYDVLARNRVRKISDYNAKRKENPSLEPMPFIVVIVDEFNDLVMQCGQEVNDCIVRLAQKARACGMHVILATQRPTVDVVSGTIKANVPCRIAFRVASQVDSQTILDEIGAENLLGRGDMLIKNNGNPLRAQGAYISDDEIGSICDYICNKYQPDFMFTHEDLRKSIAKSSSGDFKSGGKDASNESDELLYAIAEYCIDSQSCSINSIQNQFSLGFNRASRIVQLLEEKKIVSPKCGTKSREILVDTYQLREMFGVDE